jgi:hypothetical protein
MKKDLGIISYETRGLQNKLVKDAGIKSEFKSQTLDIM